MYVEYPAIFHADEDGCFQVEFPDLAGCLTYGESINDTYTQAQEVLEGYLLSLIDQGKELPKPSILINLIDLVPEDGFGCMVNCDLEEIENLSRAEREDSRFYKW